MWKEMLLQGLIALLPIFLFLVWYDRPERSRYANAFLGVCCGVAMLLNMLAAEPIFRGITLDFRFVPLLVGGMYGGAASAVCLLVLYAIVRVCQLTTLPEYFFLAGFVLLVGALLHRIRPLYQASSRRKRFKIYIGVSFLFSLYFAMILVTAYWVDEWSAVRGDTLALVLNGGAVLLSAAVAFHFVELGFERVRLQSELRDISHKYLMEVRRLQLFIDQAPLIVVFLDAEGRISHVNDYTLQHLMRPLTRKDVLHQDYAAIAKRLGNELPSTLDSLLSRRESTTEMLRFGGRMYYTIVCAIRGHVGQPAEGVLILAHDVTEVQQLKDEVGRMDRLSLVGQMAASITHEIRNPMAVIRGFVQLLNERTPADQQHYFRIILDELDRANGIINDFLSLAQNRIVEKETRSLHDVLEELLPLIEADANMRRQVVELRLSDTTPLLEINCKEIKQLVLNLARNGMEAMTDKGVLRIETVNLADTVQLRVTDSGIGITPERVERLFEPFYTTKTSGTGLGLPLCLSIAERHNGKIHVESTVGSGTTFIVSLCKPGRSCGEENGRQADRIAEEYAQ